MIRILELLHELYVPTGGSSRHSMSLLQRFGIGKARTEEAILEEHITALQAALTRCRGVAARWKRMRRDLMAALAVVMLALGFVLGVYRDPLKQATAYLLSPLGLTGSVRDSDAGYAAYEKGKYETALEILRPLAESGDARAQSTLGLMYYRGRGVPQDVAEAVKRFRLAAERGDAVAEFNLGVMYAEGQGVPQDNAEAGKWYRLAADQGNPQAQYNLGLWYAQGDGGSADIVQAHMWFNLAAARFPTSDIRNRSTAANSRDAVANNMASDQIVEAQRLAREWKPK
jgi:hypothetical protein